MNHTASILLYVWGFGVLVAGVGLWIWVIVGWARFMIRERQISREKTKSSD